MTLDRLNDQEESIPCEQETIEWYPKSKVLFFTVRGIWQCIFLGSIPSENTELAKAEIYAPVLVALLDGCSVFKETIGKIQIIVLNPATQKLTEMTDWNELKGKTQENCKKTW